MTRPELFNLHEKLSTESLNLMRNKNQDYGANADPFANFRRHGSWGILVRLSDKLARLESFEEKGFFAVKDESLDDTVKDIINYAVLYKGFRTEVEETTPLPEARGDSHDCDEAGCVISVPDATGYASLPEAS